MPVAYSRWPVAYCRLPIAAKVRLPKVSCEGAVDFDEGKAAIVTAAAFSTYQLKSRFQIQICHSCAGVLNFLVTSTSTLTSAAEVKIRAFFGSVLITSLKPQI